MKAKPQSVPAIAELWRNRIESLYNDSIPPLTPKQFGQLASLRNVLQELTWDVVYRVLSIWPQFVQEAAIAAGLVGAPSKPHIGFLLAHCDVAVNLLHSEAKKGGSPNDVEFAAAVDLCIQKQRAQIMNLAD